jgi:hypothetical protein
LTIVDRRRAVAATMLQSLLCPQLFAKIWAFPSDHTSGARGAMLARVGMGGDGIGDRTRENCPCLARQPSGLTRTDGLRSVPVVELPRVSEVLTAFWAT